MPFPSPAMNLSVVGCVKTRSKFSVRFLVFYILCWLAWGLTDFYTPKLQVDFSVSNALAEILPFMQFFFSFSFWSEPDYLNTKGGNHVFIRDSQGDGVVLGKPVLTRMLIFTHSFGSEHSDAAGLGVFAFRHCLSSQFSWLSDWV